MKLIDKYKFAKEILNKNLETLVVYIAILETPKITINLSQIAQITVLL